MRTRRTTALALSALIISAAVASGYVLNGPKWGTQQIPYYINPVNSDMSEADAIAAIQAGGSAWSAQSNANILPYYMGRTSGSSLTQNSKNEIFFRNTSAGSMAGETYWWYDGSYRLIEADIVFYDGGFTFVPSSGACSGGLFLEDVAAHEWGHALGLGHSSVASATMYPSIGYCSNALRSLDSDDLAGIEKLYPAGGGSGTTNTAPTVTISSPASGASFASGVTISFAGSASDKEDGTISGSLVWKSSIDGQIGTGASFSRTLSAGSHTITATTTDSGGLSSSRQITLTVTSPTTATPPSTAISLAGRPYKIKGVKHVDLTWAGATTSTVNIFRDGALVLSVANNGATTDNLKSKGSGSYTYRLCEAGTSTCSAPIQVNF